MAGIAASHRYICYVVRIVGSHRFFFLYLCLAQRYLLNVTTCMHSSFTPSRCPIGNMLRKREADSRTTQKLAGRLTRLCPWSRLHAGWHPVAPRDLSTHLRPHFAFWDDTIVEQVSKELNRPHRQQKGKETACPEQVWTLEGEGARRGRRTQPKVTPGIERLCLK